MNVEQIYKYARGGGAQACGCSVCHSSTPYCDCCGLEDVYYYYDINHLDSLFVFNVYTPIDVGLSSPVYGLSSLVLFAV